MVDIGQLIVAIMVIGLFIYVAHYTGYMRGRDNEYSNISYIINTIKLNHNRPIEDFRIMWEIVGELNRRIEAMRNKRND